ncbi:flavin reductase [Bartonella sp. TP]|uniref:flavin reductase n=1 Tax=Bartonella sp. TP TaxID=3057550 RepID=UPI0025B0556B|nr:flavin reductase [Bartonella sp. TP]WJW79923.1 flavin reductase [Bartonella sp. TP]
MNSSPNLREEYGQAMRYFPSALHIVTTQGAAGKRGLTISACCSLSYAPPTLLICLSKAKQGNKIFLENKVFCVNTLCENDKELATIFGTRSQEERFAAAEWASLVTGAPVLKNSYISFDCRLSTYYEHVTHYALIGEVMAVQSFDDSCKPRPLVYHEKTYNII